MNLRNLLNLGRILMVAFPGRSARTPIPMLTTLIWGTLSAALMLVNVSESVHAQETARGGVRPFLHPLFSENAVLQRDRPLPIWGWTQPGTSVVVQFDAQKQTARAADDGRWTVSIAPHAAGGPHSLSVTDAKTSESVTSKNLLFGDVWLCGGQSNMAYDLHGANNPEAEIAAANYPNIRLLQEPNAITSAPIPSFENATWQVCTSQTIPEFSGVGYFFGRRLHQELKVPIGLINASWSGTPAEAWVSGPALATMPEFKPAVDALKGNAGAQGTYAEQMLAWWQNDPGTLAHQEAPAFNDTAWQTMTLPGVWEDKGFPSFDGVMWFRRTVDVPAPWAGRDLQLNLDAIDDRDATYWNGAVIGATDVPNRARSYTVPGAQVKAGPNLIAVRVLDTGGGGGFTGRTLSMKSGADTIPLDGAWKAHPGPTLQSLPAMPQPLNDPNAPVVLFNGKIAPLLPGQIKGVIWYQGESNADTAAEAIQYRTLLPTLINDWRAHFGAQTPFYIVQLANFRAPHDQPMSDDVWPLMREAQLQTSQRLPKTPLVVTTDLGEETNVHFHNKQEVGLRLAQSALSNTYGVKGESSGPTLRDAKAVNGAMRLTFDHARGLNLKGDVSRVFAVAGADRKFQWAMPQIAGNVVTLRSANVPAPIYARFGWSDNPRASLYNAAGLPASPFRTRQDDTAPVDGVQKQADAAFDAWNSAFLVQANGQTYYSRTLKSVGAESEGSWVFALDIEVAEDVYQRTHSPAHRQLVGDLLNTFLAQNSYDWSGNTWNDDMAWMTTALIRGYQMTGNATFLNKAISAWNMAYDRGWDTKYGGGGVWENMDNFVHGDGKADKLALSNTTFVTPGVALYQITGDPAYLTKSRAMYAWVRKNIFNAATGQVNEGVKWVIGKPDTGTLENSDNVYNSGSFVQAANSLHRITGDPTYYNDALLAVNHVVNSTPILYNQGRFQTQWQYRFIKGLSEFATDNKLWPRYYPWMLKNAQAAWSKRDSMNLTWNNWLEVTNDPKINAMQTSSAAAIWQLLPPTNAPQFSGNYVIQNAANGQALAVTSAANAAPVVQQPDTRAANALWSFVPTSGGYFQIKNVRTGLVMSVAAASVRSGAKIVQRPAQGMNPGDDQWWPVQNADGTSSFFNHNSLQVLDNPGVKTAAGTQFVQGFANDSSAQKFTLIPSAATTKRPVACGGAATGPSPTTVNAILLTSPVSSQAALQSNYEGTGKFQVSVDGKTWTASRGVRVLGEKRNSNFGYSLFALDVYGDTKGR